ncbi:MAG: ABC transporter permease [Corynebacterium sp.]|uniref:ABC transporter permease n=1 Tax=Corynebacterium sp. TaxID=1720 RepID=UPI0026DB399C|nr:ABC transporter permease [Corynebacterium sp.]MDO5097910.1 ABC transporter permease [Corynebacterium sp.]
MDNLLTRILEHLQISGVAIIVATIIGVSLGLVLGRSGKAQLVLAASGGLRALPTLGLLTLTTLYVGIRHSLFAAVVVLIILAIPPVLAGTINGVRTVDPAVYDASFAMGMTSSQVIRQVAWPLALPSILGGFRSCVLQVLSTATVAAFIGMGGLGRYIIDGIALRDYTMVLIGAITVSVLALLADVLLAWAQHKADTRFPVRK